MYNLLPDAIAASNNAFTTQLAPIDLEGLVAAELLVENASTLPEAQREIIADSVSEVGDLLEEIRFEVGLAAAVNWDVELRARSGELDLPVVPAVDLPNGREMDMPVAALALLAPYRVGLPTPASLFDNPYQSLSGFRLLATWFGAQLLDSAWLRSTAVLDRLATALWCAAGRDLLRRKDGTTSYPAFTKREMATLAETYQACPAWSQLLETFEQPFFKAGRMGRDAFTHRRRLRFAGHGLLTIARSEGVSRSGSYDDHYSWVAAVYDQILRPTVKTTSALLQFLVRGGLLLPNPAERFEPGSEPGRRSTP